MSEILEMLVFRLSEVVRHLLIIFKEIFGIDPVTAICDVMKICCGYEMKHQIDMLQPPATNAIHRRKLNK